MAETESNTADQTQVSHPAGNFCWWDISTTDQTGARDFYSNVFEWTPVDMPVDETNVYTMFRCDGKDACAAMLMSDGEKQGGVPTHWNSYISVDDVEAMTDKAKSLGAQVLMPPMDVMDVGRMSMIKDPTGAVVALWKGKSHGGAGHFNRQWGVVWNELATRDAARAEEFYTKLFDWKASDAGMPDMKYTLFANNDQQVAGMMQITDEWPEHVPSNWMPYVSVPDVAATVEKSKSLGGDVIVPATEIPTVGTFAVLRDPQNGVFSVITMQPQGS